VYASQIPGLEGFVKLIHLDKGLQLAIENEFIQPLNMSEEHEGIKITMNGMIVDEAQMVLFYTIENKAEHNRVYFDGLFKGGEGGHLGGVSYSYGYSYTDSNWKSIDEKITINFSDPDQIPNILDMSIKLKTAKESMNNEEPPKSSRIGETTTSLKDNMVAFESTWDFEIPINKRQFDNLKEVYDINQTVEVDGQKIIFTEMVILPTRIGLEIKYDPRNSKKILSYEDIAIIDENGEEFGTIKNGILASQIEEDRIILYFQSNYFRYPKEIYIKASRYHALDKDKLEVIVDLEKQKLLSKPDDHISLTGIRSNTEEMILSFELQNTSQVKGKLSGVFSGQFTDADGDEYNSSGGGSSDGTVHVNIKNQDYANPIKLEIFDYPAPIEGDILVKVK
jgi:hypothetical protein